MSSQSEKIKMLNQAVSDLQAQLIAKEKQIAFLQGQVFNFQWIIKNGGGGDYDGGFEIGDIGFDIDPDE